jgi:hypothetical protein
VGISASVLGTYMDKHIMAKINEEFPNPVALMVGLWELILFVLVAHKQ